MGNESLFKDLGKSVVVYLGSAWLFLELSNFLVDRFALNSAFIDILLWLVIFGLPAFIIHLLFNQKFSRKAIFFHSINGLLALFVIGYHLVDPSRLDPSRLRLLNFQNQQSEIASSIRSIAILPIMNYSGDDSKDYLSAGIHDALISEVGKLGAIRVISRTSTLPYFNSKKSIQEIANELKVDAIMEGSLLSAGEIVRVQIKLISAYPEEMQLWSQTYDSKLSDILQTYANMTNSIAREVNITLSQEEQRLLGNNREINPDAYEAYLKGKYSLGMLSEEGIKAAMGHFNRAMEIDPEFAPPYAGMAGIWAILKQMDIVTTEQAETPIKENLQKAKALDSTLAEVYYFDAISAVWTEFDWERGEKQFLKALEINPNHSEARGLLGHFYFCMSRQDEAEDQLNQAIRLDPENPFVKVLHAAVLGNGAINPDSAIVILEPLQKMMPTNPLVNLVLLLSYNKVGADDKAFEQMKMKVSMETDTTINDWMDEKYMQLGLAGVAGETAMFLEENYFSQVSAQTFQVLYHLGGIDEKCLDWLEKGYIRRDPDMPYMKAVYYANHYASHPRFKEIARKMNL